MAVTWRGHAVQLAELFSFQSKLLFPRGVGEVGNPGLRPPSRRGSSLASIPLLQARLQSATCRAVVGDPASART